MPFWGKDPKIGNPMINARAETLAEKNSFKLYSCTIITCDSNEKVAEVHDRMPAMLVPDAWDTWLDRNNQDTGSLPGLLVAEFDSLAG